MRCTALVNRETRYDRYNIKRYVSTFILFFKAISVKRLFVSDIKIII